MIQIEETETLGAIWQEMSKATKPPEPFGGIEIGRREVAHRLISARLREQILQGEIAPGTELPPTVTLAEQWKTSYFTAHTALKNLVKEGLLERKHGAGTYVREQRSVLDSIGIYYGNSSIWTNDEKAFYRNIYGALEKRLRKLKITLHVFVDHRPASKQGTVMPELLRAIESREIHGLVAPLVNDTNLSWLLKLAIPLATVSSGLGISNRVGFQSKNNIARMLAALKAQGCRTVGMISNIYADEHAIVRSERLYYYDEFAQELKAAGMETRPAWILKPTKEIFDLTRFGYQEFHKLWQQSERPDAIIAYPDMLVRGVILGALEVGAKVPDKVKFFFHRNAHVDLLCPFPAIWSISDEDKVAENLITMVRDLHQGKKVQPSLVPVRIEHCPGERTLPSTGQISS